MMRYVPCNLCGADNWFVRFPRTLPHATQPLDPAVDLAAFRCTSADYGEHAQIVQCHACGYVYANPRWDPDDLIAAYTAVEDDTYVRERVGRELTFRRHLRTLEKYSGPANGRALLDVGAYIGVFVEVARAAGWDALGVEPSAWAVKQARRHGLPVIEGTLAAADLQDRTFDVITLWDVIEHVDDPAAELGRAFDRLNPGGIIAVHTMDIDSIAARLMGRRWPWLMAMHIHYFSRRTLMAMMRRRGFEILWGGPQGRLLRLGYIASRLAGLNPALGRAADAVVHRAGWESVALPLNFGDLITVFGRKPPKT